jgi:murein tripeptide amidase MpaA
VPYLIITSRANKQNFKEILPSEHDPEDMPRQKMKKIVVITGRVHPGETNSSFMMEGFLKFISDPKNETAGELRKRIVFKVVPCINPDGVIAGNSRVSLSGNDLNRNYIRPHPKLHPIVCAVKKIIKEENPDLSVQDDIN